MVETDIVDQSNHRLNAVSRVTGVDKWLRRKSRTSEPRKRQFLDMLVMHMQENTAGGSMQIKLRKLKEDEIGLLRNFLYEAIFIPEGVAAPDRAIIEQPELAIYYDGFGKGKADNCIVAEADGTVTVELNGACRETEKADADYMFSNIKMY